MRVTYIVNFTSTAPRLVLVETPRQKLNRELYEERLRKKAAEHSEQLRDSLKRGARRSFIFLLIATATITILWHRCGFFSGAFTVVHHMSSKIQTVGTSSNLRANTEKYENEVNQIAQNGGDSSQGN